ncbi:HNH endonuclease [Pseudarthrobacter sp. NamE2]|uniref:HNH endonuclease n=1 Tax=Pseudarthrobacter sp. NamE2 TaxID=2576838 RepID=UPI001F0E0205|nr:HNH endonuclease [Pseudarthrobacter sp. NamE2]
MILGWDTSRRDRWDYRDVVEHVATYGRVLQRWQVGAYRDIRLDTEAWLLAAGSTDASSGLIGHGTVESEPYDPSQPGEPGNTWCVTVAFDALLALGDQVRPDVLREAVPGVDWATAAYSVTALPPEAEPALRRLWRDQGPEVYGPARLVPGTYPSHAVSSAAVNRYEQDPDARRVCLAFHGTACAACGFSFEASYGSIGEGFMEVHHTVPVSLLDSGYALDAVTDLVPLCANCHAMAHRGAGTPRTVQELRNILASAGHLRGDVVTSQELEARENARRILEARND